MYKIKIIKQSEEYCFWLDDYIFLIVFFIIIIIILLNDTMNRS